MNSANNENNGETGEALVENFLTRLFDSGEPRTKTNVTFDQSLENERIPSVSISDGERSNLFHNNHNDSEHPGELTKILDEIDNQSILPPPKAHQNEQSTPLVNNSKVSHSNNNNLPSFEMSVVQSSSDQDQSNKAFVLDSNLDPKDYISTSPEEVLCVDGFLPDFRKLKDVTSFFNPFMNEIAKYLELA